MIFPASRLVAGAGGAGLLCVLAACWPAFGAVAWLAMAVLVAVALYDARAASRVEAPVLARELPLRARLREGCEIRYQLYNAGGAPLRLSLLDELPDELGGDLRRGPLRLGAGERTTVAAQLMPQRRGRLELGPSLLLVRSPLGLWVRRLSCDLGQRLDVYPAMVDVQQALSTRTLQELGLTKRRPRGAGSEFESLREYSPGDEPRHIDWRATARSRRLVVRNFHTERSHTVLIAVDCGRLMAAQVEGASKLDHALSAAMTLMRVSASHGDRIGFVAFHRELCAFVQPQRPERALAALLEASLTLQPVACEPSYRALGQALAQRQRKRALLVVLTDFVEGESAHELEQYLSALGQRHCVLLVGLRDRLLRALSEPAPEISGMDIFRRVVLQDVDIARETALRRLGRLGVQTLDLDPAEINAPLLNRYLQIREAGLL